jgi:hypothetical protein
MNLTYAKMVLISLQAYGLGLGTNFWAQWKFKPFNDNVAKQSRVAFGLEFTLEYHIRRWV